MNNHKNVHSVHQYRIKHTPQKWTVNLVMVSIESGLVLKMTEESHAFDYTVKSCSTDANAIV